MNAPDSNLYLDRTEVRSILICLGSGVALGQIDKLPIVTAADLRVPHPAPDSVERCYCSFCGKSDLEVEVMLAGPVLTFICDECVELGVVVVAQKRAERKLERDVVRCAGCNPAPLQSVASA